jgi:hypothetical protein
LKFAKFKYFNAKVKELNSDFPDTVIANIDQIFFKLFANDRLLTFEGLVYNYYALIENDAMFSLDFQKFITAIVNDVCFAPRTEIAKFWVTQYDQKSVHF